MLLRFALVILFLPVLSTYSQQSWPKEINLISGGKVVVYQPQPEQLTGIKLTGRTAVSVKRNKNDEPLFGAVFFESTLNTNKETRMASLASLKITNAKFTGIANAATLDSLTKLIETEALKWDLEIALDELIATIEKENAASGGDQFKNDPPTILYRNAPATLVILDGEPKIKKDDKLDAERVVNSPFLIFKEGDLWNLYIAGVWYKSKNVIDGWSHNPKLSKKVKSVDDQIKKQEKEEAGKTDSVAAKPQVTEIIVSTTPAELLQTKGEPDYKSIKGTSLLYAANTTNHIFKDITSQKTYILLAGRWYSANSLEGPWVFVEAMNLPADFAKIPEGSDKDEVLASVAGTAAAEEARIDAAIPQTARVEKSKATVKVEYDGSPKFKSIEGTSLLLAENANLTVMKDAEGKYFALDNGVWFTGSSPQGPWLVSDERPKEVEKIPPSSEAYNTKYVYVYESTPQYVYVGYTPGYMGCYVYGPTVVYGTGYYYYPWYGSVYYPRPVTWGFGFHYNPWTGWSMSVGVNVGFVHIGIGFGGYGGAWFGPPYYRPPYYRPPYYGGGGYYGNRPVHYGNNNININNNVNINSGNNIYKNKAGVSTRDFNRGNAATARPATANRPAANTRPSTSNNVFADKSGNVYQKDRSGNWNQRDNSSKSWKPSSGNAAGSLNRDSQMRDRGTNRANNFQSQSRPSARPARSGGGGGARRR